MFRRCWRVGVFWRLSFAPMRVLGAVLGQKEEPRQVSAETTACKAVSGDKRPWQLICNAKLFALLHGCVAWLSPRRTVEKQHTTRSNDKELRSDNVLTRNLMKRTGRKKK